MKIQIYFYERENEIIEIDDYNSVDAGNSTYLVIVPSKSKIKIIAYSHNDIKSWNIIDE